MKAALLVLLALAAPAALAQADAYSPPPARTPMRRAARPREVSTTLPAVAPTSVMSKPLAMVMAQSVGTPGGESDTQDLQPRSAQLAGEVTSGLRMNVLRATMNVARLSNPGVKMWVSLIDPLWVGQSLFELKAGRPAFCALKLSSKK